MSCLIQKPVPPVRTLNNNYKVLYFLGGKRDNSQRVSFLAEPDHFLLNSLLVYPYCSDPLLPLRRVAVHRPSSERQGVTAGDEKS